MRWTTCAKPLSIAISAGVIVGLSTTPRPLMITNGRPE